MFPRIKKCKRKSQVYEYLVLSQSFRTSDGRSTTKDVANLGNITTYDKQTVQNVIDGLIRLFEIEKYGLTEQVEILESLEYGSVILWRALWKRMGLSKGKYSVNPVRFFRIFTSLTKGMLFFGKEKSSLCL